MTNTNPIRILHVVTYMGRGGLETMLMNYYRRIDRAKVQFDVVVHREFRSDYDDEIEMLGGRIFRLPRLVPWSQSYIKTLEQFFHNHPEYKIVHVHQDCLSSVILKIAEKCGIPIRIAHSHNSNQDKNIKYPIKLFFKRQIPKYATHLFACGKDAGDWMFSGAPYRVVNNAIDTRRYVYNPEIRQSMRNSLGIDDSDFVVGHVGRFSPQKNHEFLLDVFAHLKRQEEKAVLLLVGDGELRSEMEKKAMDLGISQSVIFTGIRNDVPDLMQAMDCFVFPSNYEGLGIVAIEAQASGLSCVVSTGVPSECNITSHINHISLDADKSIWVNKILEFRKCMRCDTSKEIIRAGYDIESNASWLQNYYLELWKEA